MRLEEEDRWEAEAFDGWMRVGRCPVCGLVGLPGVGMGPCRRSATGAHPTVEPVYIRAEVALHGLERWTCATPHARAIWWRVMGAIRRGMEMADC